MALVFIKASANMSLALLIGFACNKLINTKVSNGPV